jgi:hypothetical protein
MMSALMRFIASIASDSKRLERFERLERLEPVGLIGAGVENKLFMGKLDQRAE